MRMLEHLGEIHEVPFRQRISQILRSIDESEIGEGLGLSFGFTDIFLDDVFP